MDSSAYDMDTPSIDWVDHRLEGLGPLGDFDVRDAGVQRRLDTEEDPHTGGGSHDIDADTPWMAHETPTLAAFPAPVPPTAEIPVRVLPQAKPRRPLPPPNITMTRSAALRQQATGNAKAAAHAFRAVTRQFPSPTSHPHFYSAA